MNTIFSNELEYAIKQALENKEQVLLFQNRRGYSPTLKCKTCDFNAACPNCDVSLTVHQIFQELRCHYCGFKAKVPKACPQCGSQDLDKLGFGTEKIELEIQKCFPSANVKRMDYDTAKTKSSYEKIINDFQDGNIDILVGTQMITKGLDFDNISVVGILNADRLLFFPDFYANERAFQLITQVAGRAGRSDKKGMVMIQTFSPLHPVIVETQNYNYRQYYRRELSERKNFKYPPYFRMIRLTIKHKDFKIADEAAHIFAERLRKQIGNRLMGPSIPGIARLRGLYQQQITIKMEKKRSVVEKIKELILFHKNEILNMEGKKSLRIVIDVDP
jgi:primosomal protein N' (replication factor Y)